MSKPSVFDKNHIEASRVEDKRSLLDELHLPPQVVSFIRNNSKNISIVGVCVILTILAWIIYDQYTEAQNDKAAAFLATTLQEQDDVKRIQGLEKVFKEHSRTNAALWSQLELGHIDYQAGNYNDALKKYEEVLDALSPNNPLIPLITYSIAQTFEQSGNIEKALVSYQSLTKIPGFKSEGYLGLGRLYEMDNKPDMAKDIYEEYLSVLNENNAITLPDKTKMFIEDKLAQLKVGKEPEIEKEVN